MGDQYFVPLLNPTASPEKIEICGIPLQSLQISWDHISSAKVHGYNLEEVTQIFEHTSQMISGTRPRYPEFPDAADDYRSSCPLTGIMASCSSEPGQTNGDDLKPLPIVAEVVLENLGLNLRDTLIGGDHKIFPRPAPPYSSTKNFPFPVAPRDSQVARP
jgi:hypothetical protein